MTRTDFRLGCYPFFQRYLLLPFAILVFLSILPLIVIGFFTFFKPEDWIAACGLFFTVILLFIIVIPGIYIHNRKDMYQMQMEFLADGMKVQSFKPLWGTFWKGIGYQDVASYSVGEKMTLWIREKDGSTTDLKVITRSRHNREEMSRVEAILRDKGIPKR